MPDGRAGGYRQQPGFRGLFTHKRDRQFRKVGDIDVSRLVHSLCPWPFPDRRPFPVAYPGVLLASKDRLRADDRQRCK